MWEQCSWQTSNSKKEIPSSTMYLEDVILVSQLPLILLYLMETQMIHNHFISSTPTRMNTCKQSNQLARFFSTTILTRISRPLVLERRFLQWTTEPHIVLPLTEISLVLRLTDLRVSSKPTKMLSITLTSMAQHILLP